MTKIERNMLKPSVLWRETEGGILIERGRRSFDMRGSKVHAVVSRLLPMLDGTCSLAEIRKSLPAQLHELLDRLVTELTLRHMLTSGGDIPEEASEISAEVVRLVQDRCEDWRGALRSWSESQIVIVAPGEDAQKIGGYCESLGVRPALISETDLTELPLSHTLLIWLATDTESARHAARVPGPNFVVGAAMRGPLTAIMSGQGDTLKHLPALLEKIPDLGEDFGEAVRTGLCALLADSALKLHLRQFQPAGGETDESDLRLFRRDGSVRRLRLDAALRSSGRFEVDSARLTDVSAVEPQLAPLFDRDSQLLSWAHGSDASSAYPLFHRSIKLSQLSGIENRENTVSEWGLTPEEADRRTIRAALLKIARQHEQHPPASSHSPMIAESDEFAVLAMGRAYLEAEEHGLWEHAKQQLVKLDRSCDTDLVTIIRLARLFDKGCMPKLFVASDPGNRAFVGTAELAGKTTSSLATTRDRALYEAIGVILSAVQRGIEIKDGAPGDLNATGKNCMFMPSEALQFETYGFAVGRVRYG